MPKRKRKQKLKRRKNFFPTLIITVFFWLLIVLIIYFVNPAAIGVIPLFFSIVFITLLFTLSTVFTNTRRGFLTAFGLTLFLILRYLGVGNIINFLLILGLGITIDIYFSKNS